MKKSKNISKIGVSITVIILICIIALALYVVAVVTDIHAKQMATQNLEQSNGKTNETSQKEKEENNRNDNQSTNHGAKPKAWEVSENVTKYTDSEGNVAPIPKGYVASKATGETEIKTGLVIYEEEEEVNDSNVQVAKTTRNQYVWIPVPDPSEMYGTDANRKKVGKAI